MKIEDNQETHSKFVRKIEKSLKNLMVPFNIGIIIQMNLEKKMDLLEKIKKVMLFRKHKKVLALDDDRKQIPQIIMSENDADSIKEENAHYAESSQIKSKSARYSRRSHYLKALGGSSVSSSQNIGSSIRNHDRYVKHQKKTIEKLKSDFKED